MNALVQTQAKRFVDLFRWRLAGHAALAMPAIFARGRPYGGAWVDDAKNPARGRARWLESDDQAAR
jgi:hypothetical protein